MFTTYAQSNLQQNFLMYIHYVFRYRKLFFETNFRNHSSRKKSSVLQLVILLFMSRTFDVFLNINIILRNVIVNELCHCFNKKNKILLVHKTCERKHKCLFLILLSMNIYRDFATVTYRLLCLNS